MDVNRKMRPVKTIPGMGDKKMVEGVDLSITYLIHCKNFCISHNVPPTQHNKKVLSE
jgi:hypothetical protein